MNNRVAPRLCFILLLLLFVSNGQGAPQKESPGIQNDCESLKKELKKKKSFESKKALPLMEILGKSFKKANPPEQKRIVKTIEYALTMAPSKKRESTICRSIDILAAFGPSGKKALASALRKKKLFAPDDKKDPSQKERSFKLRGTLIRVVGSFRDPKLLELLYNELRSDEKAVLTAVCEAFVSYRGQPLKVRKAIVEKLVKRYSELYAQMQHRPTKMGEGITQKTQSRKLVSPFVFSALNNTLRELTGQKISGCELWEIWFRAHKKSRSW